VISAMQMVESRHLSRFNVFNVATQDWLTVKEIAELTLNALGVESAPRHYGTESRAWKGDSLVMRLDTGKLRAIGWNNSLTSREVIGKNIADIAAHVDAVSYKAR